MTKLGIVGAAGGLGSAIGFVTGLNGLADELALTDGKKNILETQVIDLSDCLAAVGSVKVVGGDWEVLADSDVVIMAASVTSRQVSSRSEYLAANLQMVKTVASKLNKFCPEATLISATSPVDVLVMVFHAELGWERHRILGFTANDSLRFRGAVGKVLNVSPARIDGLVIGEFGETRVPVFSSLRLDGEPLKLTRSQETAVEKNLADWYPRWQSLDTGRSCAWTSSLTMLKTVEALLGRPGASTRLGSSPAAQPGQFVASVLPDGEYGLSNVALSLPLAPGDGSGGWGSIIELDLHKSELERLRQSALMVQSQFEMTL